MGNWGIFFINSKSYEEKKVFIIGQNDKIYTLMAKYKQL